MDRIKNQNPLPQIQCLQMQTKHVCCSRNSIRSKNPNVNFELCYCSNSNNNKSLTSLAADGMGKHRRCLICVRLVLPVRPLLRLLFPGTHLKLLHHVQPKLSNCLENESIRGQAWQRQREVEVPRDPMAVLQASWGPMSHFNRMRLYQLPSRFSPLAPMNWWLGNAFCVSVILQLHPPSHPMVHLPLLTASTGGTENSQHL